VLRRLVISVAIVGGCGGSTPPPAPSPTPAASAAPAPKRGGAKSAALESAKKKARDGDLPGAAADAEKAIGETPGDAEAYLLLASVQGMQEDGASARKTIDRGVAAVPSSWALHHALGMSALEAQDTEGAVKALEEARRLIGKEKNGELAADLAYAYLFAKRLEDAERLAKEARAIDPRAFAAAFTHGEALLRLGRFKEAAEAYKTASEVQPEDPLPKSRVATSLMKANDYPGAGAVLEKLVAQKADPMWLAQLAQCYIETDRPKDAVKAAEKALAAAPDSAPYRELLAAAQEAAGDKAGAKKTRAGGKKK